MSSAVQQGPGLREPDPMPIEFVESRWALQDRERRTLAWKLGFVALPILILLLVAVLAPEAFGAAVEACGGG